MKRQKHGEKARMGLRADVGILCSSIPGLTLEPDFGSCAQMLRTETATHAYEVLRTSWA